MSTSCDTGRPKSCPRCGETFSCATSAGCWCAEEPYRMPMPAAGATPYDDCLCRSCLRIVASELGVAPPASG